MERDAIRRGLRAVRRERKITLRELHTKTGISPSTVNRIERVEKYPAHKADLETVSALVSAMGLTLSEFFRRIEGLPSSENDGKISKPDGAGTLPGRSALALPLENIGAVITRNTNAIFQLARTLDRLESALTEGLPAPRGQAASASPARSVRNARSRKTG